MNKPSKPRTRPKARRTPPPPVNRWRPFPEHPGLSLPYRGWEDYPVLAEFRPTDFVRLDRQHRAEVRAYLQDGLPVMGFSWDTLWGSAGCAPGRKWGEFPSLKAAERYAWERIDRDLVGYAERADSASARKQAEKLLALVREKLRTLSPGEQLTLNL